MTPADPLHTNDARIVLFTAFEPSGDAHAAPIIRALKDRQPDLRIVAWGGDRMAEAGAELIEHTAADGSMGLNAFAKIRSVKAIVKRIRSWAAQHDVAVHVPVDSPAANFPVCTWLRPRGVRVVHVVAPQLWAWGAWRLKKLRRATDLVLCLLPFEADWFTERGVPARFIGHPRINRELDADALEKRVAELPVAERKLAIFPGSRSQEVRHNLQLLIEVASALTADQDNGQDGVQTKPAILIAAANDRLAALIRETGGEAVDSDSIIVGESDVVARWCDLALTVSGTMSLDLVRHRKPMVGVYRISRWSWLIAIMMLRTPYRLLPNIIAGDDIVPEFVPHAGGAEPIIRAARELLDDPSKRAECVWQLDRILAMYRDRHPDEAAAGYILNVLRGDPLDA